MRETVPAADEILDKYFPVLDKGHIGLIDYMGSDAAIEAAARVSYASGTRKVSDTATLLRMLFREQHASPFEQCELKFRVKAPIYVFRQWHRHRTASLNEVSGRYSIITDDKQETAPNEWRLQSTDNKQGSSGYLEEWPEGYKNEFSCSPGEYLSDIEARSQEKAQLEYEERLGLGVAREQARKELPVSTYSEMYWKCNLRNVLHFLSLRCDHHAQIEIRSFANVMAGMVKRIYPITFQAWIDYSFCSSSFSRIELDFLSKIALYSGTWEEKRVEYELYNGFGIIENSNLTKREYSEFWKKLNPPVVPNFELDLTLAKSPEEIKK